MNSQKQPPERVKELLKELGIKYIHLSYYAYPETFGSTAGPYGGIGGQAMTTFTIEAWESDMDGKTLYTCGNMFHVEDRFEYGKYIRSWIPMPKSEENNK